MEVYAWGSGNYGRLGFGNCQDASTPQPVTGVLNGCTVTNVACGWYHSVVATSSGEVATFGTSVSKNLGKADSEADDSSDDDEHEKNRHDNDKQSVDTSDSDQSRERRRGGSAGLAFSAGKRNRRSTADFLPQVLRSFPSKVHIVQVAIGSDMLGTHTLALSGNGRLYAWGFGSACGLGTGAPIATPTLVAKFLAAGSDEQARARLENNEMEPLGWNGRHGAQRYRQKVSHRQLGLQVVRPRIAKVTAGGGFSAVLSTEGEVFTFGLSAGGRLGFRTKFRAQLRPRRVETLQEGAVDISSGAGFVLLCTAAGRLASWGDNSKGQLGAGHLQESHEPVSVGRPCPAAFVMQAVAAGDSHGLALDSAGRAYSWGGEGGPMTGQGQPLPDPLQVDAAFQFRLRSLPHWWTRPTAIRALAATRVVHISAGSLHSIAVTQEGALYAWGAKLQCGLGSDGPDNVESAWLPRLLAPSPKLPMVRVKAVNAGGWHSLVAATPCCPIERMAPAESMEQEDDKFQSLTDAYLISAVDSDLKEEARIGVCQAALRARFSLPDGRDGPLWRPFRAQLQQKLHKKEEHSLDSDHRLSNASSSDDEEEEEDSSLMDILSIRQPGGAGKRARQGTLKAVPAAKADDLKSAALPKSVPAPSQMLQEMSGADEAAGYGAQDLAMQQHQQLLQQQQQQQQQQEQQEIEQQKCHDKHSLARGQPQQTLQNESATEKLRKALSPPVFSSDSDSPTEVKRKQPLQVRRRPLTSVANPSFSSDSSSSEAHSGWRGPAVAAGGGGAAAAGPGGGYPQSWVGRTMPATGSGSSRRPPERAPQRLTVQLSEYSEAVLTALVRFLCTDSLGRTEVIDENHAAWQREMHLRMRPHNPCMEDDQEPSQERPSYQRAAKGLLLRAEVKDLRNLGVALDLERLSRLCDQLLHRVDAPGAPSLFVPPGSLRSAIRSLFRQTKVMEAPRESVDVVVFSGDALAPYHRLSSDLFARGGKFWAHSFVLCGGCHNLQLEQPRRLTQESLRGHMASSSAAAAAAASASGAGCCLLKRLEEGKVATSAFLHSSVQLQLDLRETAADVVDAWLQYLYTQDDTNFAWPSCMVSSLHEDTVEAERFWVELLRLARKVGDQNLMLYAQDVLVGALTRENWAQLAIVGEQAQCRLLLEAAQMVGVRALQQAMLSSFKVGNGLDASDEELEQSGSLLGAGVSSSSNPAAAAQNKIESELDRRLLNLPPATHQLELAAISALRQGSPSQFADFKHRLAENINSAQRASNQLRQACKFFESGAASGYGGEEGPGSIPWFIEMFCLSALLIFFLVPSSARSFALSSMLLIVEPVRVWFAFIDWSWLGPWVEGVARVAVLNVVLLVILLLVAWTGLKR